MFRKIIVLLKADGLGWLNTLKKDKQRLRPSVLKGVGYLIFMGALSVLGWTLFSHLRFSDAPPKLLLSVINGFMLFAIIIVAKELMESSLKILYEAPETTLLHVTPIQPVAIFGYKFVLMVFTRFLSMLSFLGPPWVVFGMIYELPWHYYVALFPVSVCLLVLISSYVAISMMVMARFFSSAGLIATLKVLGTTIGVAVGFLLSLTLFSGSEVLQIKQFLLDWASAGTGSGAVPWAPHEWIGKLLLTWVNEVTLTERLQWTISVIGLSLISVGLAILTAHKIYQRGWENIRQLKSKRKPARSDDNAPVSPHRWALRFRHISGIAVFLGRGKIQSMMLKDFLIFIRHSGRVIAIVMLTFFLIVHIGILFTNESGTDNNAAEILTVQVLLYSLLITFGISCNGLRDEAKTWWMMKSAPITPNVIFTSKYLTALLCALVYAEFWSFVAVYLLRIPSENWGAVLITPLITLPAGCALNTMIGTLPWMAELTHQPKPFLRVLTFTVTLFVDVVLVIAPLIAWYTKTITVFSVLVIVLVGVLVLSYRIGVRNLRKLLVAQA